MGVFFVVYMYDKSNKPNKHIRYCKKRKFLIYASFFVKKYIL